MWLLVGSVNLPLILCLVICAEGKSVYLQRYYKWKLDTKENVQLDKSEVYPTVDNLPKLLKLSYEAQVKKSLFGDFPQKFPSNLQKFSDKRVRILSPSLLTVSKKDSLKDVLSPALIGLHKDSKALLTLNPVEFTKFLQQLQQFNSVLIEETRKLYIAQQLYASKVLRDCDITKPNCPYVNAPGILTPAVLAAGLLNPVILSSYILSPFVFGPFLISPLILSAIVLSPSLFSPIFVAPVILSPIILSPGVFNPTIMSPILLSPFILSPSALSPTVLSPSLLSPCILSPTVLSPVALSPGLFNPAIMCPSVLSDVALSDCAFCPFQNK